MENEGKKISFGFSKVSKKPQIFSSIPKDEKKVELIDCLEEQSIKIKNAKKKVEKAPLIIPIKDTSKNLIQRVIEAQEKNAIKTEIKEEKLSIDELAVKELIKDAQNRNEDKKDITKIFALPSTENKFILEGENEPSLEDYESVPISDYGLAMLRGMGWKEGMAIGKNAKNITKNDIPELRPKGLGLGANKMVNAQKPQQSLDKNGKELILKKGAYAKIIAGAHRGSYCEILGLDDEAGRIIVKTSIKNEVLTLNEFLVVPVLKEEYEKNSKILNYSKYEEFKKSESKVKIKEEKKSSRSNTPTRKNGCTSKERSENKLNKHQKYVSSSESDDNIASERISKRRSRSGEKKKKKKHRKHSSKPSCDSESDYYDKRKNKSKTKKSKSKSKHDKSSKKY